MRRSAIILFLTATLTSQAETGWTLENNIQERCLKILHDGMGSDDFWPAMHAAEGLSSVGLGDEVIEFLEPKLESENDDQKRCGLARELVRAGDSSKSSVLMQILTVDDPHGHVHAAESLYKVGWSGAAKPLKSAFEETENIRLKIMAAAALAKHVDGDLGKKAYAFLRRHLADESDPDIFRLSAWVLGRIGKDEDRELIRSRLVDAKSPVHSAFLEHALASLGDPEGKKALLQNLESDDPVIRTYAAVFAGETGLTEAAPYLIRSLDDENLDLRIRAAHALLSLVTPTSTQ